MSSLFMTAPFPYPILCIFSEQISLLCAPSQPVTSMFDKLMAVLCLCMCITCVYYCLNSTIHHFFQGIYLHTFFNVLSTHSFVSLYSAETPSAPTFNLSTYRIPQSTCILCHCRQVMCVIHIMSSLIFSNLCHFHTVISSLVVQLQLQYLDEKKHVENILVCYFKPLTHYNFYEMCTQGHNFE